MRGTLVQRLFRTIASCSAILVTATAVAATVEWPTRTVTIIAPFPAGGTVDIVARTVGQKLGADLHQSFIVNNRSGAGGSIGTAITAHAAPDGYTIMVNHVGLAFNATLYDNLSYDTLRDVLPVAYAGATPNVLVVTDTFPARTVAEFLALARAKPGTINYGSGGVGSAGYLPMELLQSATGIKLAHVPYKGNGLALIDLISGQIQVMLATIPAMIPYITSGQLRALATSGTHRSSALPNIPTLDEAGVRDFDFQPWYGFFAPGGTPPAIADKVHAINVVLQDHAMARKLEQEGLEVHPMSRQHFVESCADLTKWADVINSLGIKGQ